MSRARVAIGLLAVALGTAWLSGTFRLLPSVALALAPYILVAIALLAIARIVAPPAALIGPGLVLLAGAGWLVARSGLVPSASLADIAAGFVILGGCLLALIGRQRRWNSDLVQRHVSVLWGRYPISGRSPSKLAVTALLGSVTIVIDDDVEFPPAVNAVEIDLIVFLSHVEIRLPREWIVVPGRFLERGLRLEGVVEPVAPVLSQDSIPSNLDGRKLVIVNVVGLLGGVSLPSRPAAN